MFVGELTVSPISLPGPRVGRLSMLGIVHVGFAARAQSLLGALGMAIARGTSRMVFIDSTSDGRKKSSDHAGVSKHSDVPTRYVVTSAIELVPPIRIQP